jgi:prolipoprotein diacylglyceryltransferase
MLRDLPILSFTFFSYNFFVTIGILAMLLYMLIVGLRRYLPWFSPAALLPGKLSRTLVTEHKTDWKNLLLFYLCYALSYGIGYLCLWVPKLMVTFGNLWSVSFVGFSLAFIPVFYFLAKRFRLPGPPLLVLESVLPTLIIMQIFQRVACLMNGCCYGMPFAGGLVYPEGTQSYDVYGPGVEVFPTQPVESILLLLLLLLIIVFQLRGRRTVYLFPIGFGLIGFFTELFMGGFKGLTIGLLDGMHLFFLALILMGFRLWQLSRRLDTGEETES